MRPLYGFLLEHPRVTLINNSHAGAASYAEWLGIAADRIVLAGFSQGGAIALHAALRYPEKLAGLMALSTYLPLGSSLDAEVVDNAAAVNDGIPVFMAHGTFDPVLPMQMGVDSRDLLRDRGFEIEWHEYPMAHAVCAQEVDDIRTWLLRVLSA